GYARGKNETLHQYFLRYMEDNPHNRYIEEVDRCYEKISYAEDSAKSTKKKLKKMVKLSLSSL
ncbi:MAG TPA: hypothetical protein VLL31_06690, partial [Sulfurovum sp.]|nr:hypothetical protein [Sulfurovum sp.]